MAFDSHSQLLGDAAERVFCGSILHIARFADIPSEDDRTLPNTQHQDGPRYDISLSRKLPHLKRRSELVT